MDKKNRNSEYNFSNYKFPDIKPEHCSIVDYNPSQSEKISTVKGCTFVMISDGKGVITHPEKRIVITHGMGIMVPGGNSVHIKADSIEPFTVITVKATGDSLKQLVQIIETRENGIIMNFGSNMRVLDSARELITECSKTYSSDYGILISFYEFINSINEHYTEKKVPSKNVYMTRAVDYIKKNYNKNISVENIANILGIERSYLSRLFKTYKNKSTQNYIIDYRMCQAKRLFEEEDMNVSQVCAAVGYTNIYCFSRIFKSRVGIPPKEYMESCRKK